MRMWAGAEAMAATGTGEAVLKVTVRRTEGWKCNVRPARVVSFFMAIPTPLDLTYNAAVLRAVVLSCVNLGRFSLV